MKKKTIWSLVLTLALAVSAIGATAVAFAATPDTAELAAAIATENEDAIWEQIEAVEAKSDSVFQRNAALWEKLDEACNALTEDYNFEGFDEAEFIRGMTTLTAEEKAALLTDMQCALEAGEKVRVLLCGAADGGTGTAGVTLLARLLRERVAAAEIGALLILPDETMRSAKAVLREYSRTDFLRQGETAQTGVLNALYLLGTLAENDTAVQVGTNLSRWLAARCTTPPASVI